MPPLSFHDYWFRAAVAEREKLSIAKRFPPSSDVRIGTRDDNDFVLDEFEAESLVVVSKGATLHLLPTSEVRMAGSGTGLVVVTYDPTVVSCKAIAERINFNVSAGVSLFIRYYSTEQDLEVDARRRGEV